MSCAPRPRTDQIHDQPLMMATVARLALPVPVKFQHIALPEPPGSWQTASLFNARAASSLLNSPLKTSCGTPSPEQQTTPSYNSISSFSAISTACWVYSVCSTSSSQCAASNRALAWLLKILTACPEPPKGLMITLKRFDGREPGSVSNSWRGQNRYFNHHML